MGFVSVVGACAGQGWAVPPAGQREEGLLPSEAGQQN